METIEDLFNKVKLYFEKKRQKNANFDGQKKWQPIKKILAKSKFKAEKWKGVSKKLYKSRMSLAEYEIDGFGEKRIIEEHHFKIQTVRIPKNEVPSLRKIVQIGLNIGQYLGTNKDGDLTKVSCTDYVMKKVARTRLDTILEDEDVQALQKLLKL